MKAWTLLLLSLSVAMDAVAVSASAGAVARGSRVGTALKLAVTFGVFQSTMAALGWVAGAELLARIAAWDHWIAFALLAFIGARMIREGLRGDDDHQQTRDLSIGSLLILGVATSIDSLAVGVTLPMLELPFLLAISSIGLVTFALSLPAGLAARSLGDRFGSRLEVFGGAVLIALGFKILIEHLAGS